MLLQVGGQDGLDHQEAEALELHVAQAGQEVVLWPRQEEGPGGGGVVILQDRSVVVQNGLGEREILVHNKDRKSVV